MEKQTAVLKFYKDLEKYALIKDSQFILNIPLQLLRELFEQANSPKVENKDSFGKIRFTEKEWAELNNVSKGSDVTSSQTEISDEEIENEAENAWSDYEYEEGNLYSTTFKGGWKLAIKWYREQLKKL